MKKRWMAVCDPDRLYTEKLTACLNRSRDFPWQAEAFTKMDLLLEELGKRGPEDALPADPEKRWPEVLLLAGSLWTDENRGSIEEVFRGKCILMREEAGEQERDGDPGQICKYQAVDQIIREIKEICPAEVSPLPEISSRAQAELSAAITAVYSPVGRCGKTSFALTLGQILAERGDRVLYINLEEYSGFASLFSPDCRADLSDLLYRMRQKKYDPQGWEETVFRIGALDCLAPPAAVCDVWDVSAREWEQLLARAGEDGHYTRIILDAGTQFREIFRLFPFCVRIFVPLLDSPLADAKIQDFKRTLSLLEADSAAGKLCMLYLPQIPEREIREDPRRLKDGKMGIFVRKLLESPQWEV